MDKICLNPDIQCISKRVTHKISFQWKIENISDLKQENGLPLWSSIFFADSDIKTKWALGLYNVEGPGSEGVFKLRIKLRESDGNDVCSKFKLGLIDGKHRLLKKIDVEYRFVGILATVDTPKFITKSLLNDSENNPLPNDELTIYFELNYFQKYETSAQKTDPIKKSKTLIDYMEGILQNGNHCDLEVVVKGHTFSAHKLILVTRSPVFAAMFEHPMKESQQNRVEINDIDIEVFAKLLRFIYTDKVCKENTDSNIQLFKAADKYNLEELKYICEQFISTQLTVKTVSKVLILADSHLAQELKWKAIDFIKNNSLKVMKTIGWKKVMDRKDLLEYF